jgi:hypothetical protein
MRKVDWMTIGWGIWGAMLFMAVLYLLFYP